MRGTNVNNRLNTSVHALNESRCLRCDDQSFNHYDVQVNKHPAD